jgi:hypothetical protein
MKVSEGKVSESKVVEYNSMNEFYKYICETPFNDSFRWENHQSVTASKPFTQTENFDEAVELMKNGWQDMSKKLTQKLKVEEKRLEPTTKAKNVYGVAGYQAVVPLYLNGVPTNMISRKQVPVKQKVITLNKCINYSWYVNTEEIIEESIKAFTIIKKLEAQGYRCNLNVIVAPSKPDYRYVVKIRVKNSTEKLNLSKLAFPLVHPSMLRRLYLRWLEVFPGVPKSFVSGYGVPMKVDEIKKTIALENGEYILPAKITKDISKINSIEDLGDI